MGIDHTAHAARRRDTWRLPAEARLAFEGEAGVERTTTRITNADARPNAAAAGCRRSAGHLSGVDDPRRAELVYEHPESLRPERRLERHLHLAILRERTEDAFSICGVIEV